MVRYFLLAISILALIACTKEIEPPEDLMSTEEMVPFLIDIHIAEAKVKVLKLSYDTSLILFRGLEEELYNKHEVNDSIYQKSLEFYLDHPDLLLEIYERVIDSLSLREKMADID